MAMWKCSSGTKRKSICSRPFGQIKSLPHHTKGFTFLIITISWIYFASTDRERDNTYSSVCGYDFKIQWSVNETCFKQLASFKSKRHDEKNGILCRNRIWFSIQWICSSKWICTASTQIMWYTCFDCMHLWNWLFVLNVIADFIADSCVAFFRFEWNHFHDKLHHTKS